MNVDYAKLQKKFDGRTISRSAMFIVSKNGGILG